MTQNEDAPAMPPGPDPALKRLELFVGTWTRRLAGGAAAATAGPSPSSTPTMANPPTPIADPAACSITLSCLDPYACDPLASAGSLGVLTAG